MVVDFRGRVAELKLSLERAKKAGVSLANGSVGSVADFRARQHEQLRAAVLRNLEIVSSLGFEGKAAILASKLRQTSDVEELDRIADELLGIVAGEESGGVVLRKPKLPLEIRDEVYADMDEVQRCIDSGCYRSAVILCGRILETALHRKYYEVARNDLLEKFPGIGLGNLVARLSEKGVRLDPGLGNQIHLINQVRVHSVHQKQDAFRPSLAQAQAIFLYTMDVVEKLFKQC